MTSVDRLGNLLAQIRASLLAKSSRSERSRKTSSASSQTQAGAKHASSAASLQASLVNHLSTLDLRVDDDLQRARQLFVELILVTELGANIASDPRFSLLAREVEHAMASDPEIRAELSELLIEIAGTPAQ